MSFYKHIADGQLEVNTIIGDAVETPNGTVIIPVSRMCCGFASGGTHVAWKQDRNAEESQPPFGGGAGAGVSLQPVGFLLVGEHDIRFQVVDHNAILDRLIDEVPQMVEKMKAGKQEKMTEAFAQKLEQAIQDGFAKQPE